MQGTVLFQSARLDQVSLPVNWPGVDEHEGQIFCKFVDSNKSKLANNRGQVLVSQHHSAGIRPGFRGDSDGVY